MPADELAGGKKEIKIGCMRKLRRDTGMVLRERNTECRLVASPGVRIEVRYGYEVGVRA
jgi:hypothetical protein